MVRMSLVMVCLLLISVEAVEKPAATKPPIAWAPTGLSGGGALFAPAMSPLDGKLMMINCDMSAVYLTKDGGDTWTMIPKQYLLASTLCKPAFHPADREVIYAAYGIGGQMQVTRDGGATWSASATLGSGLRGEIAIAAVKPAVMFVGATDGVWRSTDSGATWNHCTGPTGIGIGFYVAPWLSTEGNCQCYAATEDGIWRSSDDGATWTERNKGLTTHGLLGFAGASDAKKKAVVLYCSMPCSVAGGALTGGIHRTRDMPDDKDETPWVSAAGKGLNTDVAAFDQYGFGPVAQYPRLLASNANPNRVYAFSTGTGISPPHHNTVYRTDDGGRSWMAVFQGDPRFPGANVEPDYMVAADGQYYQDRPRGVAMNDKDQNAVMMLSGGNCYMTKDAGKTWQCRHTRQVGDKKPVVWRCNGLVVTSTWNVAFDPFDTKRMFICYTDIGFSLSTDRGATWRWWGTGSRPPWLNTCYEVAFDPKVNGLAWGAFSNVHDIPNGNIVYGGHGSDGPGGVCVTTDHCESWKTCVSGLPLAPVTSIVMDPSSPVGKRTLYAGIFGKGVYRSRDGGSTWKAASSGLGSSANQRVVRVILHADGTLFALVTGLRINEAFAKDGPGIYRSTDKGDTWTLVPGSDVSLWPKDITVDPTDSKIIYLGACNTEGKETAGLYRTKDGGVTWKLLANKGAQHFGAFLHPQHPGWIYMTVCEGAPDAALWLSTDDGETWQPMYGMPFSNAQRVVVDPSKDGTIWVATFGGSVWHGPERP